MSRIKVTLACGWYDRIEPLKDKRVVPDGMDLSMVTLDDPRELFDRLIRTDEFDAAEMSSAEHIARCARGVNPFVALPVFTSRVFRHSFICINRNAGIRAPKNLEGKRIGVPLYSMSAAIWCRGLLRDEYGVDLNDVTWVEGSMEHAGSHGSTGHTEIPGTRIIANQSRDSLTQLLESGQIDATIGALMPSSFGQSQNIVRLFPNFREIERDYYRRTHIHPIMHLIVIRRDRYERNPWIAASLYAALAAAKAMALERMRYTGAPKTMLPLLHAEVEETEALFGRDPWPDGVEANRATLETAVRYMREDGLIERDMRIEELFIPTASLSDRSQ